MEEEECLKCEGDCLWRLSLLETVRGWNSFSLETFPLSRNSRKWGLDGAQTFCLTAHCSLHLAESRRTCERHLDMYLCIYTWRGLKIIIKSRVARYLWRLMFCFVCFLNIALKIWRVSSLGFSATHLNQLFKMLLNCAGFHALLNHSMNDQQHLLYLPPDIC